MIIIYTFFSYNNISDFISGYSLDQFYIEGCNENTYVSSFPIFTNERSPFQFFDDMEILDLKFAFNKSYLYYKLNNKQKNKIYYGILDIKANKILYNFDEDIKTFILIQKMKC